MYHDYVTQEFTIRDLLTHRSGLGLGAGDLMFFPDSTDFTINDIIHNLRYLKPTSAFRTKYDYDNLLYMVAGEVVAQVSGKSWTEFVEERIMRPLQMHRSAGSWTRLKETTNVIDGHAPVNGKVQVISRHIETFGSSAGGIYSSVADMSKWMMMQLQEGRYGDGLKHRLFSPQVHQEMWTPHTFIPVSTNPPYNTHFSAYGLGWFLSDVKGYKQVTHTGGLEGMVTQVLMLPELQLGIMVFTNQQSGAAFNAISNTIKDSYLGLKPTDWVNKYQHWVKASEMEADKITTEVWQAIAEQQKNNTRKINYSRYTGTYRDDWFGEINIREQDGRLWFISRRSPKLNGEVLPYKDQTFIVKWANRSFDADAFLTFETTGNGQATGIKMKAISPLTDFSYDFHDLDFKRIEMN
jgi:CubicO group peptidase (beta-lactamase class C family)